MMDDTVYRQDAIEAINSHFGFNIEEEYGSAVQEVINGLPSAQPEIDWEKVNDAHNEGYDVGYWAGRRDFAPQWIPCSERLPENDELVLVTDDSGGVKTVDFDRCGQYECSKKRFWYYTQNVVAWMPLPKPYRAERRTDESNI